MKKASSRWGQEINWRSATSYDATQAIIEAIESSTVVTRAAILENLKKFDLLVDRTLGYDVWQIRNGRFDRVTGSE